MGSIWVALDAQLQRRVALKLMRADNVASESARTRFQREAMAIAQIQNPHVVQVYDYGIDEGHPFIVMELLEGEDLDARLNRLKKLPLPAVAAVITQAARALSTAHAAGIVHRDLKPANIFLARAEAGEVAKILDFGVAAISGVVSAPPSNVTRVGTVLGTPHYMSPEQARSARDLDYRSDLWSLAVVAYRALTGEHPFSGESLGDLIVRICTDPFAPASQITPGLRPEVDRFFERALAKDPARRYQSARDLAEAFAGLAGSEQQGRASKILVIDDEPDLALLVKQRFRQQIRKGVYEFVFASDGQAALNELQAHPDIDLALSDINMPGMDGLTFLGRAAEASPMVEVVMVSAYGDMTNIRTAMNRGAFDFIVKPIDFKDLELTIEKTLRHVREARTTARSAEENSLLRMFVSGTLVDRLDAAGKRTRLPAGEIVKGTVAFIDICGFGKALAERPPDAVRRLLNANFELILPEIAARDGVIDKFIGDAVMALFLGEAHIERALDACLSIRAQLESMSARTGQETPYAQGISIGIDTGELLLDSIGSKALSRLDFTAIGGAVNSAARLSERAQKNEILIGKAVYEVARTGFECEAASLASAGAPASPTAEGAFALVRRFDDSPLSSAKTVLMDETHDSVDLPGEPTGPDATPRTQVPLSPRAG